MNKFEKITMPHIRYMSGSRKQSHSDELFYMGGEPIENSFLVFGQKYELRYLWFSPDRETKREYVWIINIDKEYYHVDIKNFGTVADLRERIITQILD